MENYARARAVQWRGCKPWHCTRCELRSFRRRRDVLAHIRTAHGATNRFWEHRHKVKTGDERFQLIPPQEKGGTEHGSIRRRLAVQVPSPRPEMAFPSSVFDTKEGMTLRDYLAASALQGMLGNSMVTTPTFAEDAANAYIVADAMLEARKAVRA